MDKQVIQVDTPKNIIDEATDIMVIAFITCIPNSGNTDQTQMGNRKAESMESGPRRYGRLSKVAEHLAPDAAYHKIYIIGRDDTESRADNCCNEKNWRMLSTTDQLCDIKVFHKSYEGTTNVPVGRAVTAVVHDDGTVYILILNEALLFGKSTDHSLINPNQIW